jgi:hypothetical protein
VDAFKDCEVAKRGNGNDGGLHWGDSAVGCSYLLCFPVDHVSGDLNGCTSSFIAIFQETSEESTRYPLTTVISLGLVLLPNQLR